MGAIKILYHGINKNVQINIYGLILHFLQNLQLKSLSAIFLSDNDFNLSFYFYFKGIQNSHKCDEIFEKAYRSIIGFETSIDKSAVNV